MIPGEFNFYLPKGTGAIYNAKLDNDGYYRITGHGVDCKYKAEEVDAFLENNTWRITNEI